MSEQETIVLIPGMYSPRLVLFLLARRLQKQGYRTVTLSNRFLSATPADNARRLLPQIQSLNANVVHLLGHSLGGLVILHLLAIDSKNDDSERLPTGRVILMSSPVRGSELANRLFARRWFRPLLGKSVQAGLLGGAPTALHGREAGIISGSSRRGLSALYFKLDGTNDGVVSQSETELAGASDTVCIPHSHALMLFSRVSGEKAVAFFRQGRFD